MGDSFRAEMEPLYGLGLKLSNREWSTNERLFKMDSKSISYFSKVDDASVKKAKKSEIEPKHSIALDYVKEIVQFKTD